MDTWVFWMGLKNLFNLLQDFERVCVCVESAQKRKPINLHDCSLYRHITWYRTTRPTIPLFWFWIYLFIYDWWWGWWWSSWKWCTLLTWEGVPIINTLQFSYEKIANNDEDDEITNTTTKKYDEEKLWNEMKRNHAIKKLTDHSSIEWVCALLGLLIVGYDMCVCVLPLY